MTILSFKPKRRGGGHGAGERHIVFKLKARLLFPRRSLSLLLAQGRRPSAGTVIHQGPVTAAEGLPPPQPHCCTPRWGQDPNGDSGSAPPEPPGPPQCSPFPTAAPRPSPSQPSNLGSILPSSPWLSSPSALRHPAVLLGATSPHTRGARQGCLYALSFPRRSACFINLQYLNNSITRPSPKQAHL